MDFNEISCIEEKHIFSGMRVNGTSIIPVTWTFTIEITPISHPEQGKINKSVIAYEKVKFWIENVLEDLIVAIQDSDIGVNLAYGTDNPTLLTPYVPTDNHLVHIIHAKLNAIGGEELYIGLTTLSSSETMHTCKFNTLTGNYNLPEGDNYIEDMYHDTPWWHRPSFDFADFTANEVEGDPELQAFLSAEDPIVEFEHSLIKAYDDHTDKKPEKAEIIKMPKKWSPKII